MDENENKDVSNDNDVSNDTQDTETSNTEETETETVTESETQTPENNDNARMDRLESTIERILGELSSLREAQGIMVENGAVINDASDTDVDFTDADHFVPPSEMDLLI